MTNENWLHLDIAGVMSNKDEIPYLGKGMSGRHCKISRLSDWAALIQNKKNYICLKHP